MNTLFDLFNSFFARIFSAFSAIFDFLGAKLVENGLPTAILEAQISLVGVAFGLYLLRFLTTWIIKRSDFNQ